MMLNLLLAAALLPARFSDASRYDVVTYGEKGYDLALTRNRPSTCEPTPNIVRGTNTMCLAIVPCEEYARAWVLCDVSDDPAKDPAFVLRLTRYVTAPMNHYRGRAYTAMADSLVELKGKKGRQMVEVPLKTGDIQDLVFTDERGDEKILKDELAKRGLKRYLDLELLGRTSAIRRPLGDTRMNVDRCFTSGVTILAVALEKPSATLRNKWIEPGNIFHNDEKPETLATVDILRPGDHRLRWTVKDPDGKTVAVHERKIERSETLTVDLSQKELGWYELVWELFDGDRLEVRHQASFALLGKDTRKTGQAEGPYGACSAFGTVHYRIDPVKDFETGAKLFYKQGMRRNTSIAGYGTPELWRKYKLGSWLCVDFEYNNVSQRDWTDEQLLALLRRRDKADPTADAVMIFHEDAAQTYRHAEEVTGGTHSPTNDMRSSRIPSSRTLLDWATRRVNLVRRHFPNKRIIIGNSLTCSELTAEMMRFGVPKDFADYMGDESVVRNNLPERIAPSSIQAMDCHREVARRYGYPWGVTSCFEHCYRLDALIGADLQAWWWVRDLVLMQCWRFPDIWLSDMVAVGNHYADSFWGDASTCGRTPFLYPKKSYVGLATATKILDQVVSRRHVPTGDDCVHLVEFPRKDGTCAYALWSVRGEADVEIESEGAFEAVDFYGRAFAPAAASRWNFLPGRKRHVIAAREQMTYLVAGRPVVTGAKCLRRRYDEPLPADYRDLALTERSVGWTVTNGVIPNLDQPLGKFPCRIPGKGTLRRVTDAEKGEVLELELADMRTDLPPLVQEYTAVLLERPVPLKDRPATLGVWVKGNSGWGEVHFIVEDNAGRWRLSTGYRIYGQFDYDGLLNVCYSGWRLIRYPFLQRSSMVDTSTGDVGNNWTHHANPDDGSVKIVGIAFSAQSRPLFLDEHRPKEQKIRIGAVGGCDFAGER